MEYQLPDREGGVVSTLTKEDHIKPSGWYSIEVMATAVLGIQVEFRFPYILDLEPLHVTPEKLFDDQTVGALVNIEQSHWVAIKYHGGIIWLLDSAKVPIARQMSYVEYKSYIQKYRDAYFIKLKV